MNLKEKLASSLHDKWRETRKKEDGSYEPRWKSTKDQKWINQKGTNQTDIANTDYENLPEDWQAENKASAEVAVEEIAKAINQGKSLDENFVESASAVIHKRWVERNESWAPSEQKVPYTELVEEEKEKDRDIIREAIVIKQNF
jgi:hypothetical protein